jgi:ClpP class serine protease
MPTWGELLERLQELRAQGRRDALDVIRREALADLANYTGRNVVLYASGHLQKPRVAPELLSITNEDIEGFMEVFYGLQGSTLDIVLHSPGGRAEATEGIVKYLRSKFQDVRVFVPHEAMSAATMLACAANRVVMGPCAGQRKEPFRPLSSCLSRKGSLR